MQLPPGECHNSHFGGAHCTRHEPSAGPLLRTCAIVAHSRPLILFSFVPAFWCRLSRLSTTQRQRSPITPFMAPGCGTHLVAEIVYSLVWFSSVNNGAPFGNVRLFAFCSWFLWFWYKVPLVGSAFDQCAQHRLLGADPTATDLGRAGPFRAGLQTMAACDSRTGVSR